MVRQDDDPTLLEGCLNEGEFGLADQTAKELVGGPKLQDVRRCAVKECGILCNLVGNDLAVVGVVGDNDGQDSGGIISVVVRRLVESLVGPRKVKRLDAEGSNGLRRLAEAQDLALLGLCEHVGVGDDIKVIGGGLGWSDGALVNGDGGDNSRAGDGKELGEADHCAGSRGSWCAS